MDGKFLFQNHGLGIIYATMFLQCDAGTDIGNPWQESVSRHWVITYKNYLIWLRSFDIQHRYNHKLPVNLGSCGYIAVLKEGRGWSTPYSSIEEWIRKRAIRRKLADMILREMKMTTQHITGDQLLLSYTRGMFKLVNFSGTFYTSTLSRERFVNKISKRSIDTLLESDSSVLCSAAEFCVVWSSEPTSWPMWQSASYL